MFKLILFLLLTITSIAQANDGLSYQTYYCGSWPCTNSGTPLSTGTVSNINYNWGGGNILNSGRSDNVSVIFRGYIIWPGTQGMQKTVTFYVATDDGSLLKINNQTVFNDWTGLHPAWQFNANGSITFTGGKLYSFEFWFSEWGGGAVAQLYWDIGNGPTLVPNSAFFYNQPIEGGGGYFSEITDTQIQIFNDYITRQSQLPLGNRIYIDQQIGSSNNNIRIEQHSNNNTVQGLNGGQYSTIQGQSNDITIRQGEPANSTGKNLLEMNLVGNLNILEINQARIMSSGQADNYDSNGHITRLNILGSNNTLRTQQTNTTQGPHFMSVDIIGNYNNLNLRQLGDNSKKIFSNVTGDNNSLTALQTDQGNHYLDINLYGSGNTANVTQKGTATHRATINLTNAGGPNNLTLLQQGTINQVYSINQNCVTSIGCAVSVTQGQ